MEQTKVHRGRLEPAGSCKETGRTLCTDAIPWKTFYVTHSAG